MTLNQFAKREGYFEPVTVKKENGTKHYLLWWESSDDWYLNVYFTKSNIPTPSKSCWIIRKDVPKFFKQLEKEGYKIHKG